MAPKSLLTKLQLLFLPILINSQQFESPCPQLFTYTGHNSKSGEWYGTITLLSDVDLLDVWLRLTFDSPALRLENSFGEVVARSSREYFIEKPNFNLKANVPHGFSFILKYSPEEPLPKLLSFDLNGKLVCFKKSQLLADEHSPTEGIYAWYSSFYYKNETYRNQICATTLISQKYAITAAHCVTAEGTVTPLNVYGLYVYMDQFQGKYTVDTSVLHIILHPQYNAPTYGNDIAVIRLHRFDFFKNNYFKAIPLWQESPDLNTVVNKQGSVVSGIFDEKGRIIAAVLQKKMTVVSQETCLRSSSNYSTYTSNKTYCAENRNGATLCDIDLGVGMVFPHPNSSRNNPVWQLRGIAVGVAVEPNETCGRYAVFTDVAKYLDWIDETMFLYDV